VAKDFDTMAFVVEAKKGSSGGDECDQNRLHYRAPADCAQPSRLPAARTRRSILSSVVLPAEQEGCHGISAIG
jgi:hypothetical protein